VTSDARSVWMMYAHFYYNLRTEFFEVDVHFFSAVSTRRPGFETCGLFALVASRMSSGPSFLVTLA
jgi:hypothetical protein